VRVDRVLGSCDCGRIVNPKTAASRFRGGIIVGIGLALMEDTDFDERAARNRRDWHHRLSPSDANAIVDATGRRVPDLPITLDKLL
jgi:CO/xanthine dehydrogenase Mo-binding subunit